MKRLLIISMAITVLALPALAAVPNTMNVQGMLTDEFGNPLPNGNYLVEFELYNVATGGNDLWGYAYNVQQQGGIFNAILYDFDDMEIFDQTLWLQLTLDGEAPMEPRIRLTSVPTAMRAATVAPGAAVHRLNNLWGDVDIVGGSNVTVTVVDNDVVISATGGGTGGDDGDWTISGSDIYRPTGQVFVGVAPGGAKADDDPPARDGGERDPSTSKMTIRGYNEGLFSVMRDNDGDGDGRAALFAKREREVPNHGTGFGVSETNTAVTGYNDWGDSYTFGVAGYTWFDFNNTGGVLGARNSGTTWGSLAFRDSSGAYWGMYTPGNTHVGGLTQTQNLQVRDGATAGYIMTSDVNGNASWQPPSATGSDGDWTISGNNMFATQIGATAIGTSYPHPLAESTSNTTLQVASAFRPSVVLDKYYGGLSRWSMYQYSNQLRFARTTDYAEIGTTTMSLDEGKMEIYRDDGGVGIRLQGAPVDEAGSRFDILHDNGTLSISLDGQGGPSLGGRIDLRDGSGSAVITMDANYADSGVGRIVTPVLEITGGSDLSEQFDIGNACKLTKPGMVVSIDPQNPGQLTLSDRAYDRRVAGVISGAGGVNTGMLMGQRGTVADGEQPVALVGRVYVWADATDGPIEPGDLLTTADRPGHAMKVADHDQATGAILGKAMTGLEEGQGLILTLVTLQ